MSSTYGLPLPEELTDRILQFASLQNPDILKICSQFHRIGLPHVYHHVVLTSKHQSTLFLQSPHSHLAKSLVITADAYIPELLSGTHQLSSLDIELLDEDVHFDLPPSLTQLTIRKSPTTVYLTSDGIKRFIHRLADQLPTSLTTVHVAFKLSDPTPDPASPSPIAHLASALEALPGLHTFTTLLPSVWSDVLLVVSRNSALKRITLGQGIVPTGLFMNVAVRHPRLMELIRAGTPIIRHRAQTLPQNTFPPSLSPISTCISTPTPAQGTSKKQAAMTCSSPQSAYPHPRSPHHQHSHPHNARVLQRRFSCAHP